MQDRHEVVLEANITNFKNKMKEAQNISKSTGKKIAENAKFGVWKDGVYTLSNGMQFVRKNTEELNQEIKDTGDISKQTGTEISTAFNKGLKSVKKLTLGFLGVRTAFGLFRKYMSEYSRENEVFAQKMQLTSSVVANALAPAFEFFGNVIQYAVIGLARVIELLFGVNILGRTVDNSLKGASKSAKELNDNLSGLDEISNIDKDTGSLDNGIRSQLTALKEFQDKIKEVEELFNRWGVKEKIQKIKEVLDNIWNSKVMQWIKDLIGDIVDWSIEHPNAVATILGGMALVKLISKIMGVSGGTGLLGLVSNLEALKIMGPIAIGITVSYFLKEKFDEWMDEEMEKIDNTLDEIDERLKENRAKLIEDIEKDNSEAIQNYYNNIYENYDKSMSNLANTYDKVTNPLFRFWEKMNHGEEGLKKFDDDLVRLQNDMKELYEQSKLMYESDLLNGEEIENFKNLIGEQINFAEQIGYTKDEVSELIDEYMEINTSEESLQRMAEKMRELGYTEDEITDKLTPFFMELNYGVRDANGKIANMKNGLVSMFERTYQLKINISAAVNTLNAAGSIASQALKNMNLKVPSYDIGTDYIPRDQLAMVHEGERIIPKKYNNSSYLGGLGNSETNSLLMELNRNILELANKPTTLNVNGKEFAKATFNDYQEESSRRGTNTSVRRV